ncbi:hypothetical protein RugamoR64_62070 [Duganella rhizosphaerae]|uniref:LPD7 domain-containing protein n=1 Tax=Duganella rhizosphaerae TaxID=2885763 RepID=UPI0030EA1DD4
MLIRIGGGKEGIKEYLENGHKQGREFTRDELDERVILAGDLDFTDQLIHDIDSDAEKYLHITLSFKEDVISRDAMENIVRDFEEFAFAAYGRDEYNFYAEAHLPKIKSYINQKTGETVERKPHIHFVIPKVNLLSGGALNPFGLVEHSERFIDAFQEHVNNKYGLASPKNNRRIEFTDASDMINRYKDDEFEGNNRDLKKEILGAVLDRGITSYEGFKELLTEFGDTKTRNSGKDNEYLNVKPADNVKGVNLKEFVFSREFIELSDTDKRAALSAEVTCKYEVAGAERTDNATINQGLEEWFSRRAMEVKYLNSGNTKLFLRYKEADADGKHQILADQANRFYTKYKEPRHESEGFKRNPFEQVYGFKQPERGRDGRGDEYNSPGASERGPGRERAIDGGSDGPVRGVAARGTGTEGADGGRWEVQEQAQGEGEGRYRERQFVRLQHAFAADRSHDPFSHPRVASARSINGLRTLSSVDVVGFSPGGQMLLPDHAPRQLVHQRSGGADGLRRHRDSERGSGVLRPTGRLTDSRLSQHGRDLRERDQFDVSNEIEEFRRIRMTLDAHRLLADLSQSHGVLLDKYEVIKAPDGSARIVCGNRKLNVSDFLTREMRLSWNDAAAILRDSYGRQESMEPVRGARLAPSSALWRQFQNERKRLGGQRALWTKQFASEKSRRDALKHERDHRKHTNALGAPMQRKAQDSVAKMTYVAAERNLEASIRIERKQLAKPVTEQYREFLRDLAETGHGPALAELRRMAKYPAAREPVTGGSISAAEGHREENGIFYRGRDVKFRVHINGDVVYTLGGRAIIEDRGSKLVMLQTDRFAVEAGLRLAEAKFGSIMIVSGPKEFRERSAIVAAEAGLKVTFQDKGLEQIREQRAQTIASERAQQAHHRKLGREYQPPAAPSPVPDAPVKRPASPKPERGSMKDEPGKKQDRER